MPLKPSASSGPVIDIHRPVVPVTARSKSGWARLLQMPLDLSYFLLVQVTEGSPDGNAGGNAVKVH
jgi:hypothetical protein